MPTVNQGASQTLSLGANDSYKVTIAEGGEAYVDLLAGAPGAPYQSPRLKEPTTSLQFGPYGVAAMVRIRSVVGTTTYDQVGQPLSLNQDSVSKKVFNAIGEEVSIGGGGAVAVLNDAAQVVSAASALNFGGPLKATAAGQAVTLALNPASVFNAPVPSGAPTYSGYTLFASPKASNIGFGGHPRRRNLMNWTDASDCNVRIASGSGGVVNDYSDPNFGEPYNAANAAFANQPTNGKSVRLTWSANSSIVVGSKTAMALPVNVVGKNIYFRFKMTSGSAADLVLNVRLFSTATPSGTAAGPDYHSADFIGVNASQVKVGPWQVFALPIEAFNATGAGADLSAITHIYVHVVGVTAANALLGDVWCAPKVLSRGVAIVGFDDCRQDTWTHGSRYMRKYGLPGVLYPGAIASVIRAGVDQYQMSIAQIKRLQDHYGWQVASQAWSTENPDTANPGQTLQQFATEMAAMAALYEELGLTGGADGSFFSNVNKGGSRDPVFEKAFRSMRTFTIWSSGSAPNAQPDCVPYADPYNMRAWGMDTTFHTVALTGAFVDKAIANKGVARFIFHGTDVGTANFTQLIDYLAQRQDEGVLDVMTEDQLAFAARARAFP